jgi:hypothetical protein
MTQALYAHMNNKRKKKGKIMFCLSYMTRIFLGFFPPHLQYLFGCTEDFILTKLVKMTSPSFKIFGFYDFLRKAFPTLIL